MIRTSWWDGFYVDYDRLVTGEIAKVRENGATSGVALLASYGYDDLGRKSSLTRGNGTVTSWSYDPVSRLASLTHDFPGTAQDLTVEPIGYNAASQIASAPRSNDAFSWTDQVSVNRPYESNGLNQYASAGIPASASSVSFGYDDRGNLTSSASDTDTYTYNYSSENMLKSASGGVSLYYDGLGR